MQPWQSKDSVTVLMDGSSKTVTVAVAIKGSQTVEVKVPPLHVVRPRSARAALCLSLWMSEMKAKYVIETKGNTLTLLLHKRRCLQRPRGTSCLISVEAVD